MQIQLFRNILIVFIILIGWHTIFSSDILDSVAKSNKEFVPTIDHQELLDMLAAGKKIVFVDARESPEFEEERIPGALNITLREIKQLDMTALKKADLVISYCVKDFRGYEVAKAFKEAGLDNIATMKFYGLNGWKSKSMPLYNNLNRATQVPEKQLVSQIQSCAKAPADCR